MRSERRKSGSARGDEKMAAEGRYYAHLLLNRSMLLSNRDDPTLHGKPVVVAWPGKRSVVCAASSEGRRVGVRSALSLLTTERLSPEAIFVKSDFVRYEAVSLAQSDTKKYR
jgi:nucleotidyltransferase/DNA polymerase involved in DNA repair